LLALVLQARTLDTRGFAVAHHGPASKPTKEQKGKDIVKNTRRITTRKMRIGIGQTVSWRPSKMKHPQAVFVQSHNQTRIRTRASGNEHPEGGRLVRISPLHRNRDIFLSARRHSFALQSSRNTMGATTSTQPPLATTPFPPTQATAAPPLKQAASTEEGDGGGSSSFLSADSPDDSDHHLYHLKFPHRQEDGWHSFVPFADAHQHHHGPLASPPAIKH
jgi:hypothetical protein